MPRGRPRMMRMWLNLGSQLSPPQSVGTEAFGTLLFHLFQIFPSRGHIGIMSVVFDERVSHISPRFNER